VLGVDNRRLARIAKLAGAPQAPCAGIDLHVRVGDFVERGQPLFTLHADSPGELAYALDYAAAQAETVHVSEDA
jgi:thymidine phosphorylase